MNFDFTDDQRTIKATARELLASRSSFERVRAAEQRGGGDGVADLLEQDRELDGAQALPAVRLGDRDSRPAELRELAPQRDVGGPRLGVLAHALGLRAVGEELARRALDLALIVRIAEVHVRSS